MIPWGIWDLHPRSHWEIGDREDNLGLTLSLGAPDGHMDPSSISSGRGTVALPAELAGCRHRGARGPAVFHFHHGECVTSSRTSRVRRSLEVSGSCGKVGGWEAQAAGWDSCHPVRLQRVRRGSQDSLLPGSQGSGDSHFSTTADPNHTTFTQRPGVP